MPNINASLANLAHQSIFSTLDCRDAYFVIELEEESIPKTAVCTPYGLYEFVRLAQGLRNSSSVFARAIHNALNHLSDAEVIPYQDDALVIGRDFQHHLVNLDKVLGAYEASGFVLQIRKCKLF